MRCSLKHITLSLSIAMGLLAVTQLACGRAAIPSPTPAATMAVPSLTPAATMVVLSPTPAMAVSPLTKIVKDIAANPQTFAGRQVTLVGYYRGWDLMGEAGSGPPVTRSDWVIRDDSGAIYVAQAGVQIEGGILNPGSKADTNRVLRVTGIVRVTGKDQPYIEAQRIELVK